MKVANLVTVVLTVVLAACGGGGGGGDSEGSPSPTPVSITCPDGSSATSAAICPTVAASGGAQSAPGGTTVAFSGTLANATGVLWKGDVAGTPVAGTSSLATDMKTVKFTPTVRLAHGQTYTFVVTGIDSVGRTFETTASFALGPLGCADNAIWSNPATFVPAYPGCVAPIGEQTKMDTVVHAMTDASCVMAVGSPLSAACKLYAANGTLMFADTSITVNGQAMVWIGWFGQDGSSNLALVDAAILAVVAKTVLANPLVSMIGNPTGVNIRVRVGTVLRTEQVTINGSELVVTCRVNCS